MNKLKMHTSDLAQANVTKIRDLFPSCVTEAHDEESGKLCLSVDFDQLRQELSSQIVEGTQERYRLDWPGKRQALAQANEPIVKTLRPDRKESVDFDLTRNLFVEGDNFEALKVLEEAYLGSVKLIYIDPPYNTGRNLIYKNDFSETTAEFLGRSGQVGDEGGNLVANLETNGRFHSDWLSMMYQRLRVAKKFLAKDGVLVCAIDENEFGTLSILMKEIFSGSAWEHAYISVVHNPRGQQGTNFSYVNEYLIFVFPSGIKAIGDRKIEDEDVSWSQFRNWGGESERTDAKNCFYPVLVQDGNIVGFGDVSPDNFHPNQTEWKDDTAYVYPIDNVGVERKWRYARQSVDGIFSMLRAKRSGSGYQIEIGKTFGLYKSVWTDKRYDSNEYGTKLVNSLVEGSGFTFPKSLWAVYDPIAAVTWNDPNAIVMDFFAGSATTAHAVMQLNADDGGNRQFIMVQFPAPIEEDMAPFKRGFTTIAEISKERIRRAGEKVRQGECHLDWKRDIGFRVLKVDTSNMQDVYYRPDQIDQRDLLAAVDNIKPGRTAEDLLFQVLIDWGVENGPALPILKEVIEGKTIFYVNKSPHTGPDLLACFDKGITEELVKKLAETKPLRAVFRDNGFVSDVVKINVVQIFRQVSPKTEVKSI
jgi:adenine-specific DNA-methyltransferase